MREANSTTSKKCYNCGSTKKDFYWLVTNGDEHAYATCELNSSDYTEHDTLTEVECCGGCNCDL